MAYGQNEGLPSLQSVFENSPTAWRAADGRLWFSTRNGLLTVTPGRIRQNPTPPPVHLMRVRLDDQPLASYDSRSPLRGGGERNEVDLALADVSLELGPAHEKLEFEFTALSLGSPENVHFRHRLRGFDQEWVEVGAQRSARYPRLPGGRYEFEVTACNEAGVWNPTGTSLGFSVRPFLWQTWWFRFGVLVVFTGSVVGLVRYFSFRRLRRKLERLERQAELQRERARIARDMHDEVGAKLSRLSLLSEMAGQQAQLPPAALGEVAQIAETARETIRSFDEIVWAVNPKNDSLSNLAHYLCRFAEDFFEGSATQCVFELPEEIPAVELSTETRHHVFLATKEALNNALKHAKARRVTVRLRLQKGGFEFEIQDDGQGFNPTAPTLRPETGNGLSNMRERMRMANGELELTSTPGHGTRVRFRLPCAVAQSA
jgi:signal transduction histidine kinase